MEMYGIHHGGNFGNNFCGEAHKLICRNPTVGNESFCFRLEIVTTSTSIVGPHIGLYDAHVGKLGNIFSDAEVRKQNVGMRIGEEKAQAPSSKNQILKRLQKVRRAQSTKSPKCYNKRTNACSTSAKCLCACASPSILPACLTIAVCQAVDACLTCLPACLPDHLPVAIVHAI